MLIGLCGGYRSSLRFVPSTNETLGTCSGKQSVAHYLIAKHGFVALHLDEDSTSSKRNSSSNLDDLHNGTPQPLGNGGTKKTFSTIDSLIGFLIERWKERWVTTDIWDNNVLKHLSRRPFFLLIGVEAPLITRWHRLKQRQVWPSLDLLWNVLTDLLS